MAHLSQRNGMNRHHQRVIPLVLLNHLQGTGFVAVAAIEGIAQEQQHRFITRKLRCLIHRMTKATLLTLVDIMQVLANIQDARLQLLRLSIELAQMLIRQGPLEIIRIQLALLLRTQHETDFLNTTLDEFLEQDQDDRTYHAIGTGNREEILLQGTGGGIKTGAKACHRNDRLTDGMHWLQRQCISLHALLVEIVDQLVLRLLTARQELYRAIAMRADTLTTPYQGLDIRIL